jgi:hypothetical protein
MVVKGIYGFGAHERPMNDQCLEERSITKARREESTKKSRFFFFSYPDWLDNISDLLIISFELPQSQVGA